MLNRQGDENQLPQKMLTVRGVASILSVHTNTVRTWEKKGLLKSYSIGPRRSLRFMQEDVLDFLSRSRNQVPAARG